VLGDPLEFTRSPELHRAALEALGIEGRSRALRTAPDQLPARLAALAEEGYTGVNLTHPLKEAVLPHLARITDDAERARSVNTVGFASDGWWGESTDGPGFVDLLRALSREPAEQRVVLLGAGGAARSLALALASAGAEPAVISARRPEAARGSIAAVPARVVPWRGDEERAALAAATVVVNATPLDQPDDIVPQRTLAPSALVIDLKYGERLTPWVTRAREAGREAFDGLGLLVFQARRSLSLWLGREVPLTPLSAVVGWPR
jgi:shikimate dehydrogenase